MLSGLTINIYKCITVTYLGKQVEITCLHSDDSGVATRVMKTKQKYLINNLMPNIRISCLQD